MTTSQPRLSQRNANRIPVPWEPVNPRVGQRYWNFLAVAWAAYFFAVFSIGRYPEWIGPVIWGGAFFVGLMTIFAILNHTQPLPREAWILWAFALWSLTGLPFLVEETSFWRSWKLCVELAAVVSLLGIVLRRCGSVKWFYFAFIGSVFFNVLVGLETLGWEGLAADSKTAMQRDHGLTGNANGLGFYCFIGLVSVMGLFGETNSKWLRLGLLFCTVPSFYGLVSSASRGAFSIFLLSLILWPLMCLRERFRRPLGLFLALILIAGLSFPFVEFVLDETYMGQRLNSASRMEDHSSQFHLELFFAALKVFASNPIIGVGLGQFQFVSELGYTAHDEWSSLLSGTGAVGFLIFISVYISAWLRLSQALRRAPDPLARYRVRFARMILILLVVSAIFFRVNFVCQDSFFLLAIVVGTADWAARANTQKN